MSLHARISDKHMYILNVFLEHLCYELLVVAVMMVDLMMNMKMGMKGHVRAG